MNSMPFNASTHRIVIYKGKPVALPLLTYWKLNDLNPDDTVVISGLTQTDNPEQYQRVKVSELTQVENYN